MWPSALISRRPAPSFAPIVAMQPSMTPMSARKTSDAVASVPLRTTRSYSAMIPPPRYSNGYSPDPRAASFPSHRKREMPAQEPTLVSRNAEVDASRSLLGDGEPAAVHVLPQACLEAGQQPVEFG